MSTWSSRSVQRQPARRRKRSITIRRPRVTKVSGVWGVLTAVISLAAVMVQSTALIVTAVISLLITVVAAFAGQSVAVPTRKVEVRTTRSPGRKPSARRSVPAAGTKPRKRPKCSVRCQRSTKDASTCDCVCGGKTHGPSRAGGAKVSRDELKAKPARRQERQVVRSQRKSS